MIHYFYYVFFFTSEVFVLFFFLIIFLFLAMAFTFPFKEVPLNVTYKASLVVMNSFGFWTSRKPYLSLPGMWIFCWNILWSSLYIMSCFCLDCFKILCLTFDSYTVSWCGSLSFYFVWEYMLSVFGCLFLWQIRQVFSHFVFK